MTRFSIGRTAAYRRLHELVEFGLIRRHRLLYNDAGLLTATPDGLRWADLQRLTPARVSLALLPHTLASAALAALLEPDLTDQTLLSDREHRAAERAAAQPLASAIMGSDRGDHRGLHQPDLVLIGAGGEPMTAIEIELTLKTKARLERILRGYLRNPNLATVRYYAPPHDSQRSGTGGPRDRRRRAAGARTAAPSRDADHLETAMNDITVPLDHRLLTAEEVAELLRLPVSTIYDLARTGRLPHLRIGRALRFSQSDLEAHLAESCRGHIHARV